MNLISVNPFYLLGGSILALSIGFGSGWQVNGWRKDSEIGDIKLAQSEATLKTERDARKSEQKLNDRVMEAQNGLTQAHQTIIKLSTSLATTTDGLRNTQRSIDNKLSALPVDALRDIARTYGDIFAECRARREGLAIEIERVNAEKRTLMEAWSK